MNFLNLLHPNLKHSYDALKDTSSANYAFFKSLIDVLQAQEDDTIKSKIQSHLNTATGSFLDEWGAWIGSKRQNKQSDKEYRLWLIRYMTLKKGSKTAIIDAIKIFFNMYDAYIKIKEPYKDVFRLDSGVLDGSQYLSGDYYRWGIIDVVVDRPIPKAIYSLIQEFKPAGVNFYVTVDTTKYGKNKILEISQDVSFGDLRHLFVGFDKTRSFSLSTAGNDKYTDLPQWFILDQSKLDSLDLLAGDTYLTNATTVTATVAPFIYGESKYGSTDEIGGHVVPATISSTYDLNEWTWATLTSKDYYDQYKLEVVANKDTISGDKPLISLQYYGTLDNGNKTDSATSPQPLPSDTLTAYFDNGIDLSPDSQGRCGLYMVYNIQTALLNVDRAFWLSQHPSNTTQIVTILQNGIKEIRYSWLDNRAKDNQTNSLNDTQQNYDTFGNLVINVANNGKPFNVTNLNVQITFKDNSFFNPTVDDDRTYITSFGDGVSDDNLELLGNSHSNNGFNMHTDSKELYTIDSNKVNDGSVIGSNESSSNVLYIAMNIGKQLIVNFPSVWNDYYNGTDSQTLRNIIDSSTARWNITAKSYDRPLTLAQWDKVGLAMFNFATSQWDYVNLLDIPTITNVENYLTTQGYMFVKVEANGIPLELYSLDIQGTINSKYLPLKVFTEASMQIGYANS